MQLLRLMILLYALAGSGIEHAAATFNCPSWSPITKCIVHQHLFYKKHQSLTWQYLDLELFKQEVHFGCSH